MGKNGIPDRWLPYSAMGSIIPGTRFIACKVPLKDGLLRSLPENERFGPKDLLEAFPKVGLLIDLTNTTRYYFKQDFTDKNIRYEKIFCPGKVVPPNSIVKQFFNVVDDYLATETDPDAVIVVHCTHGVNRTGYFICRYMIERLNIPPEEAVKNFQLARGHNIERDIYVSDLKNGCKGGSEADLCFVQGGGFGRGGYRGDRRPNNNFRRRSNDGFNDDGTNRRNEIPEKRRRDHYNSNDYRPGKWNSSKHPYFNNVDRKRNQEEDSKYSYNWRDRKTDSITSFLSTTPLPQFTPHHQASSRSPYQPPAPPSHAQPSSAVIDLTYDDAGYPLKGHFPGPSSERSKGGFGRGFNPPSHTQPYDEAAHTSIPKGRNFFGIQGEPYIPPVRNEMSNSGFRENYHHRDRMSGEGRGRGRGGGGDRGRFRGRGNWNNARNRSRGNGPPRNNYPS